MPHTRSQFKQDQGFGDGILIVGPEDIMVSGTGVRTRNAVGDWSINQAASLTNLYAINIGQLMQRTGLSDKFLEQYGGSNPSVDALPQGIYGTDYTGNPVAPRTAFFKKGVKLVGIKVVGLVSAVNLVAATCRLDEVLYVDNAAVAVTNKLASAANGLPTAFRANPYVSQIANFVTPGYEVTDLQELLFEMSIQTNAGGTYRLYRLELQFEFNCN